MLFAGAAPAAQAQQPDWGDPGHDVWHEDQDDGDGWSEQPEPVVPDPVIPEPVVPEVPVEPEEPVLPTTAAATVAGRLAILRTDGRAAIPRGAPKAVREIIRNANQIVGKRYKWGGGHGARLADTGYDCSGAVSYPLVRIGLQRSVVVSGRFTKMHAAGAGRHVTIYAHKGHVYMEVAGLRLDTSAVGDPRDREGVRWRPVIGPRPGFKVRHPAGL